LLMFNISVKNMLTLGWTSVTITPETVAFTGDRITFEMIIISHSENIVTFDITNYVGNREK